MRHDRTTTGRTRQIARTLLTVTALLGAVTTHPAVAAPTPDAAVTALLRDAQPGARYTMSGSVAETCDRLAAAGLTLLGVGDSSRDQNLHVFHDATRGQYLSVLAGEQTVIRVTSDPPTARMWLWAE
ncbi:MULTISPECIES: hypothetical protein [Deinococcus]|uniref:Secreted protein n=1 Tax=Deinococcus rufus TaxID=2136097 RepID=A0ABV7ZDZ4_9DEIO|nr:hypothetical protein [Deinococcus sp. AB2017081]WQE96775.1 hypothetical protein U2P90_07705 [Deinococcus sp. AB2017081]